MLLNLLRTKRVTCWCWTKLHMHFCPWSLDEKSRKCHFSNFCCLQSLYKKGKITRWSPSGADYAKCFPLAGGLVISVVLNNVTQRFLLHLNESLLIFTLNGCLLNAFNVEPIPTCPKNSIFQGWVNGPWIRKWAVQKCSQGSNIHLHNCGKHIHVTKWHKDDCKRSDRKVGKDLWRNNGGGGHTGQKDHPPCNGPLAPIKISGLKGKGGVGLAFPLPQPWGIIWWYWYNCGSPAAAEVKSEGLNFPPSAQSQGCHVPSWASTLPHPALQTVIITNV